MSRLTPALAGALAALGPASSALGHAGHHGGTSAGLFHVLTSFYHMAPIVAAAGLTVAALALARSRPRLAAWLGGSGAVAAVAAVGVFAALPA